MAAWCAAPAGAAVASTSSRSTRCLLPRRPPRGAPLRAIPRRAHHAHRVQCAHAAADAGDATLDAGSAASYADAVQSKAMPPLNWQRAWYAAGVLDALEEADAPIALTLLGTRMALWRDATGAWCAVRNECSHRLAPLSEGRVAEDGTLQCSYHGWRFDGCGACRGVPQDALGAGAVAARSRRAAVAAFPTMEAQGLLYIWPCADDFAAARATPPPLLPADATEHRAPYVRDVAYGYDTLIENLSDPAHVAWSHHGVVGNRHAAPPSPVRVVTPVQRSGYSVVTSAEETRHLWPGQDVAHGQRHTLHAPAMFTVEQEFGQDADAKTRAQALNFHLFMAPLTPGVTRVILRTVSPAGAAPPSLAQRLTSALVFPDHLFLSLVFEGDMVLLHGQERLLRAAGRASSGSANAVSRNQLPWRNTYYLATNEDTGVACSRRWLDEHGGGGPFGAGAALPECTMEHAVMLDRWTQHAAHCPACRRTGLRAAAAARALRYAAGAAAAASAAGVIVGATPAIVLGAAAAAPALGAAAQAAGALGDAMHFEDYVHSLRK